MVLQAIRPEWAEAVILAAAVVAAVGVLWRKVVIPLVRFFRAVERIAEATPILLQIAEEFTPNGGDSLRDTLDGIETTLRAQMHRTAHLDDVAARLEVHLAGPSWSTERGELLRAQAAMVGLVHTVVEVLAGSDSEMAQHLAEVLARGNGIVEQHLTELLRRGELEEGRD